MIVPYCKLPPDTPFTYQVTAVFAVTVLGVVVVVCPATVTEAVKVSCCLTITLPLVGVIFTAVTVPTVALLPQPDIPIAKQSSANTAAEYKTLFEFVATFALLP